MSCQKAQLQKHTALVLNFVAGVCLQSTGRQENTRAVQETRPVTIQSMPVLTAFCLDLILWSNMYVMKRSNEVKT